MTDTVQALEFRLSPHRVVAALTAGRFRPEVIRGGTMSPLRLREVPRPVRRPGWVRVAPSLAGICASDQKMLKVTGTGTTLMALYGVPRAFVPGHEVVGVVTEADAAARVSEGDRVVLEPILSCIDKGFAPCERCEHGDDHRCARLTEKGTAVKGMGFGLPSHGANLGGGWSDELVAPAHRAFRVPDDLDDNAAVLAEPLAIAVHAVLRSLPAPGSRVLVIGPGPIGLSTVYALSYLAPEVQITVAGLGPFADDISRRAGADHLVHGTRRELVESVGALLDTTVHGNRISGPVLEDGFDAVFDCVGSEQTLDDAFRMTRPGGTIVLVGTSSDQKVDWSLVWARELTVRGTVYYGDEHVPPQARVPGGRRRAMATAVDILTDAQPSHLVTHIFPLHRPVEALSTAAAGPGAEAVKVAFQPGS